MAKKVIEPILEVIVEEVVAAEEIQSEIVLNIPPTEREDTGHGSRDFRQ